MDMLAGKTLGTLDQEIAARIEKRASAERTIESSKARKAALSAATEGSGVAVKTAPARSSVATDIDVPAPPFWGSRVVEHVDLDEIYPFINTIALFRGQWQFKKGAMSDAEYEAMLADTVRPIYARLKDEGKSLLTPKVVYGYFPCLSDGDDLIVYDV